MKKILLLKAKLQSIGFTVELHKSRTGSTYLNISNGQFYRQVRFSNHYWTSSEYFPPDYNLAKGRGAIQLGFNKIFYQIKFDYQKSKKRLNVNF